MSLGIFVQGIIFAVVQSKGMDSLMILGCEPISQATMSGMKDPQNDVGCD